LPDVREASYKSVTEDGLLRMASDHYDLVQIISRCSECFQAYKDLIHKKRLTTSEGGLTAEEQSRKGFDVRWD
jgi:hypothetical protein